jgi:dihydrofolate reductase
MLKRLEPLAIIVAYTRDARVIGRAGTLPWRYPEDLKWFRETTMGHAIIMVRELENAYAWGGF